MMQLIVSSDSFRQTTADVPSSAGSPMENVQICKEQQVQDIAIQQLCDQCGKSGALFLCGRCRLVNYCCHACQKAAWKTHHRYVHFLSAV